MSGYRKTSSIVWKINTYFQSRKLAAFLMLDVVLWSVSFFCWCAAVEMQYGGFVPDRLREFGWIAEDNRIKLLSLYYTFVPEGQVDAVTVHMGAFFYYSFFLLGVLLVVQFSGWALNWVHNDRKLRRFMRPIDEAAMAAERISVMGIDEQRLQSLERAIDKVDVSEDAVHIGDTDLLGLENAINNLLKRLQASYREQTRFVDDASHELRTPIAVIQGYASMLERWGMDDRKTLEESVHAIREESDHMKELVDQLLFLARGDQGRQQPLLAPVDVSEMMKEVQEESEMIDADHRYLLQAADDVRVVGDAGMLKQAVRVLTDNAAKYTPKGGTITLRVEAKDGEALLCVQDEGIGLEAEEAARMFERFFRGEQARGSTKGSGLGLSIARWIVDRHRGRIDVLSYKGIGTRMTISLPESRV